MKMFEIFNIEQMILQNLFFYLKIIIGSNSN